MVKFKDATGSRNKHEMAREINRALDFMRDAKVSIEEATDAIREIGEHIYEPEDETEN